MILIEAGADWKYKYLLGFDQELPVSTTAVLFRRQFILKEPLRSESLVLQVGYDDGFAAYLNGTRGTTVATREEPAGYGRIQHSPSQLGYANPDRTGYSSYRVSRQFPSIERRRPTLSGGSDGSMADQIRYEPQVTDQFLRPISLAKLSP